MRQAGYYFVSEIGQIAYYNGVHWTMCGSQDRYLGHAFEPTHPTPITPEKIQAIDEIIAMRDYETTSSEIVNMISNILNKHNLI